MKVIAIGDPHFRIDNIKEVEEFIEKIVVLIAKEKPDFVVCLGDLLHTHERLHTIALNKAYEFIQRVSELAYMYVLVGNHDYIQNQQFLTTNHWMNAMKQWKNVCIVDKPVHYHSEKGLIIFCPYVPNGRFIEALDTESGSNWRDAKVIFAHQEFRGCKMGAITSIDGDIWPLDYPNVVSGHIHSKQTPQPNIYYTGSALQHAFGESEETIIAVFEFRDNRSVSDPSLTEVDLGMPKKKIVYTSIDKLDSLKIDPNSNVKLTICGSDYNEFKTFKKTEEYKQLIETGAKVVFKTKEKVVEDRNDEHGDAKFKDVLYGLCAGNVSLTHLYNLVVCGNDVIELN